MDDILKSVLPPHVYDQTEKWLSRYKTCSSVEEQGKTNEDIEKPGDEDQPPPDLDAPSSNPLGEFQAQHKFGSHLTTRPFIGSNLHSYLKKHERFAHIN